MGKVLEAGSCSLSESNTPPSLLKLDPNIESEEIGKNTIYIMHYDWRILTEQLTMASQQQRLNAFL